MTFTHWIHAAVWLVVAAAGVGFVYLYGVTAKRRWGATVTDIISMMAWRLEPDDSWPRREVTLHTLLYVLKFIGLLMISLGVGIIVGGIFYDHTLLL